MKPWEKYADTAGPWVKYAEQAQPPAAEENFSPVPESVFERFLVGYGASASDILTGLNQRFNETLARLSPNEETRQKAFDRAAELRSRVAEERRLRAPLMETGAGKTGNVVGTMVNSAVPFLMPGTNTLVGAGVAGAALGAAQPTAEGESALVNTGQGAALGLGGQAAANAVGAGWRSLKALRDARQARIPVEQVEQEAVKRAAIDKGLRLPGDGVLEGLGGKIKVNQRLSELNQPVVNQLAKQELGLPMDAALTPETFRRLRQTAVTQGYTPVRALGPVQADAPFRADLAALEVMAKKAETGGFPALAKQLHGNLDDVVSDLKGGAWDADVFPEVIQAYRDTAADLLRGATGAEKRLGRSYRKAAEMLENLAEREMVRRGNADGLQQFRAARQLIAKSFDVEEAVNPGTLNVRASVLGRKLEKGKPLTGDLRTIAQTERGVRGYGLSGNPLAEPTTTSPPFSPLDLWGSVMAGGAGAASGGPFGFAAGALPLVRPIARAIATSGPYQRAVVRPSAVGPGLLDNVSLERVIEEALRLTPPGAGFALTNE